MKAGLSLTTCNTPISGGALPPPTIAVTFGALTQAGAGGLAKPAAATSIANAGGTNLVLSGQSVVPDTGGGPASGTVVFDDGTEWIVTAAADEYSVASASEMNAAISDTGSAGGKTVRVRAAGFAGPDASIRFANGLSFSSPLTVAGEPGAVVSGGVWFQNCSNVVIETLGFTRTSGSTVAMLRLENACSNIIIQDCVFQGGTIDHLADYEITPPQTATAVQIDGINGGSDITIRRSRFNDFWRGISGLVTGQIAIEDNEFTGSWLDPIELSFSGGGLTSQKSIRRNIMTGAAGIPANYPVTGAGDNSDPHTDFISFTNVPGTGQRILENVAIVQNVMFQRRGDRGRGCQGITTFRTGSDYMVLKDPLIAGNVMHFKDASHGITIPDIDGGVIVNNTSTQDPADGGSVFSSPIAIGGSSKAGNVLVQGNIADAFALGEGSGSGTIIDNNNVTLGRKGAVLAYATVFDSSDFTPDDFSDVLAQLAMRANGPADIDASGAPSLYDAGAIGSGYAAFGDPRSPAGWSTDGAYEVNSAPAPSLPTPALVTFDGTDDYLTRGGGLTGAADGQFVAGYFKGSTLTGGSEIFSDGPARTRIRYNTSRFAFNFRDPAGATVAAVSSNSTGLEDGVVREFWFTYDAALGVASLSIDGGANDAAAWSTMNTGIIDCTQSNWALGALASGTQKWDGSIERFALWLPPSLAGFDVESASDRSAMADHTNNSVNSVSAIVDFFGAAADWNAGTNFGSGGGFTMNGSVV